MRIGKVSTGHPSNVLGNLFMKDGSWACCRVHSYADLYPLSCNMSVQTDMQVVYENELQQVLVVGRTAGGRGMLAMLIISSRNSGHFFMMAA